MDDEQPNAPTGRDLTLAGPADDGGGVDVEATLAEGASRGDETIADGASLAGATIARVESTLAGPEAAPAASRPAPAVPGYVILGELGRGAMGVVYLARQALLNRACALKMILAGDHASPEASVRFLAEAEAVARLRHPNVVQIHHIGQAGGLPFFELEYCEGGSLDKTLDGTPRPPRDAAALVEGIARGVSEAHRLGLVHRDLKPANVLLGDDGTPKVTDFGLVKVLGSDPGLTRTDSILGSPSYMAPEQARGLVREVGPRSDVYSLGAILYELLTGRPPFRGATVLDTLQQVKLAEPVPPSRLVPGLPRDAETIALKCLEKDPMRRYASASELADDLRRFLDGAPILARPTLPWERAAKWARRRPALAAMIAAVQVLLVALLATVAWSYARVSDALGVAEDRRIAAETAGAKESEARAKESVARSEAEASRNAALAETARALLSETRALRLSHEGGWRGEAMKNLSRLAALETPSRDIFRLRTEAVACLGEPDARPLMEIGSGGMVVWNVEFRPDGKALAINDDKTAQVLLWDLEADRPIRAISKADGLAPFAFRPDGSCLAVAAPVSRVVFEPMAAGAGVPPPLAGPGMAHALAFDRAGGRLAVAWYSNGIKEVVVYDVASGSALRTIPGPFDPASFKVPLALAPDGSAVAAMGPDHEVRIWKVAGDDEPRALGRHLSSVKAMAFSPDGTSLATSGQSPESAVKVWDVAAGRERLALHGHLGNVWGVAFSPDGAVLASAGGDSTLRFWDPRDGRPRLVAPTGPGGFCQSVAFAPDGRRVAIGGPFAKVIELEGFGARKALAGHDNRVNNLAFRPGRAELASAGADNRLISWDLEAGSHRVLRLGNGASPHRLAYAPDGTWLVIGSRSGQARTNPAAALGVVDPGTGGLRFRLVGPTASTTALDVDRSGRRIAAGLEDGTAIVWDVATRSIVRRIELGWPASSVAFLPASGDAAPTLFAATAGGRAALVDLAGGTLRAATIHGGPVAFAVSPGRDRLAAGSPDGSLRLVRLPDLAPLATSTPAGDGRFAALAFHPGGRLLASACNDRRVVVRDAGSLRPLFEIAAPMSFLTALAFSPDRASLAFSGDSDDVIVWDFAQILSRLDALGLGWDTASAPPAPTGAPAVWAEATWTEMDKADTRSGVEVLSEEAGPGAPAAMYRRALVEMRRDAESRPKGGTMNQAEATLNRKIASLYLLAGDRPGFERHRAALLDRVGDDGPPIASGEVAWASVQSPGAAADPDRPIRLAERAIRDDARTCPWWHDARACALMRAGRLEEALRSLDEADRLGAGWDGLPLNDLVRAIVRLRQGRPDLARPLLDAALLRAGRPRGKPPEPGRLLAGGTLQDSLTFEVLRREAEALLLDAAFPADPFAK